MSRTLDVHERDFHTFVFTPELQEGETISSYTLHVSPSDEKILIEDDTNDATSVTFYYSIPDESTTVQSYKVTCRIVTSTGRVLDLTETFRVTEH